MLRILLSLFSLLFFIPVSFAQVVAKADSAVFTKVEVEAEFPGDRAAWINFLRKNLNGSVPVNNDAPTGQYSVWVQFIVSKDGNVSDIKALTKNGYGTEEEVIRVIEKSGKWTPAILNGMPVNAYRKQPVTFLNQQDDFEIHSKGLYTLYAGVDNEIIVSADKVKAEDISATISKGTITAKGDGKFIVQVPKTDERVIIEIFNAKKKDKKIGATIFSVKAP